MTFQESPGTGTGDPMCRRVGRRQGQSGVSVSPVFMKKNNFVPSNNFVELHVIYLCRKGQHVCPETTELLLKDI